MLTRINHCDAPVFFAGASKILKASSISYGKARVLRKRTGFVRKVLKPTLNKVILAPALYLAYVKKRVYTSQSNGC